MIEYVIICYYCIELIYAIENESNSRWVWDDHTRWLILTAHVALASHVTMWMICKFPEWVVDDNGGPCLGYCWAVLRKSKRLYVWPSPLVPLIPISKYVGPPNTYWKFEEGYFLLCHIGCLWKRKEKVFVNDRVTKNIHLSKKWYGTGHVHLYIMSCFNFQGPINIYLLLRNWIYDF